MTEPTEVRAFVNGAGVSVARGATVIDAVRLHDAATADALVAGSRAATDSRGLPVALDAPVSGGPAGAQGATLSIMAGGAAATFERVTVRCRPGCRSAPAA